MIAAVSLFAVPMLMLQAVSVPALVGLWDFSGLAFDPDITARPVDVHDDPSTAADVIARLDKDGISSADGAKRLCSWERDLDADDRPRGCIYAESGYEIGAVAVFAQQGQWLRIAVDNSATRFGWVLADGAVHPLADLVGADRLTYLTERWNRRMYDAPDAKAMAGGGRAARLLVESTDANFQQPYRAVGTVVVQGRLWLRVELLDQVCTVDDPRVVDAGWVPAQSAAGEQWTRFSSRGC